jgi:hypothetical protein
MTSSRYERNPSKSSTTVWYCSGESIGKQIVFLPLEDISMAISSQVRLVAIVFFYSSNPVKESTKSGSIRIISGMQRALDPYKQVELDVSIVSYSNLKSFVRFAKSESAVYEGFHNLHFSQFRSDCYMVLQINMFRNLSIDIKGSSICIQKSRRDILIFQIWVFCHNF